jgi:hypothetical protein
VAVTRGRLRRFPYFKVQAYDAVTLSWRDCRKEAFDDERSARAYQKSLPKGVKSRIMKWDKSGNHPLD